MIDRADQSGDPFLSTDTDVQTAAATQLDEDGASSAVSPTLGAAVVLAKYPTLLLVVLAVGVLSRDIEPQARWDVRQRDAHPTSCGEISQRRAAAHWLRAALGVCVCVCVCLPRARKQKKKKSAKRCTTPVACRLLPQNNPTPQKWQRGHF